METVKVDCNFSIMILIQNRQKLQIFMLACPHNASNLTSHQKNLSLKTRPPKLCIAIRLIFYNLEKNREIFNKQLASKDF